MPRRRLVPLAVALLVASLGCTRSSDVPVEVGPAARPAALVAFAADPDTALFAGGCFWCMETAFEGREGVIAAVSGFAGGNARNPTYDEVSRGGTGHAESVLVVYDPGRVSYERLLAIYWHNVDPFSAGGQFCDRGDQYRSAIFALDDEQLRLAQASWLRVQERFGRAPATQIYQRVPFYPAEEYHQDFYRKDPERYHSYRQGCGRDARLREVWGADAGLDDLGRPDAVH